MNLKVWLHSLIAAAIGGGASALSAALVSPDTFNLSPAGLKHLGLVALFGVAVPVLALLKQSPIPGASSTAASSPAPSAQTAKLGALALCCLMLCTFMTGCTAQQTQTTQTVISDISAYLPTVLSLVGAFAPLEVTAVSNAEAQIKTDLSELQTLVATVNPSATTWANVQAIVNELVSDGAAATNDALAIKDPTTQKEVLASLAAVTAAIAIIDSYVTSGQTQAQVKAKLATRITVLKTESRTWTPAQRDAVLQAYGL